MIFSIFEQFEIFKIISFEIFGIDMSFTNSSLFLLLSLLFFVWLFIANIKNGYITPTRWQSIIEMAYETIYGAAKDNIGKKAGKYLPFVFSLLMFIVILNTFGVVPYTFAPTAHLALAFGLSISIFIAVTLLGIINHGFNYFSMFMPAGCPMVLAPMIVVIEIISHAVKGLSLGIRLAANITAGHILLAILSGFAWNMLIAGGFIAVLSVFPMFIVAFITVLEIAVAFIQAYVFSLLVAIYIGEAEELH